LTVSASTAKGGEKGDSNRNPWLAKMDGGLLLTRKLLNQGFPEVKRISKKNDMDVNEHERISNISLKHKLK
jgi:hypothetical protein